MPTGTPTPARPEPPAPVAARTLGRYELLREIASGGMAAVYLGRARGMAGFERLVAIKVCHPHLRKDDEFATMFLDEARLAARIHHPNVVATLDVAEDDALYLVMEYVDGERLSGLVRAAKTRDKTMPPGVALQIMTEALLGLHAAHEQTDAEGNPLGLVHRDVSPQNIMVGVDGVTKIVDFGIAKAAARATVTRDGQIKGKLSYMPPEQLASAPVISRAADIYAAGVVLWETLTGRRLFAGDTDVATLNQVLRGVVTPVSQIVPGATPALDAVIARALERDPARRFATAAAFAEALEDVGVKVATTRAVSAWVQETCAGSIAERRAALRALTTSGGGGGNGGSSNSLAPGEVAVGARSGPRLSRAALGDDGGAAGEPGAEGVPGARASGAPAARPAASPPREDTRTATAPATPTAVAAGTAPRGARRTAALLGAVGVVALALAGVAWLRGRGTVTPPVASAAQIGELAHRARAAGEPAPPAVSSRAEAPVAAPPPREPSAVAAPGESPVEVSADAGPTGSGATAATTTTAASPTAAATPSSATTTTTTTTSTRRHGRGAHGAHGASAAAPGSPGGAAAGHHDAPPDPERYRPGAI